MIKRKVYLCGAGALGAKFLNFMKADHIAKEYKVLAFLDNEEKKAGACIQDVPILHANAILQSVAKDTCFVITTLFVNELTRQLEANGIENSIPFYEFPGYKEFMESTGESMVEATPFCPPQRDKMELLLKMVEDEESRKIISGIIEKREKRILDYTDLYQGC